MELLLEKMDNYIKLQEKKEEISLSLSGDIFDIIEMVKKSKDRDSFISTLNDEVKQQIQELIAGGIL